MKKILFVDDDNDFQKVVVELLESEGYQVDATNNSVEGLEMFKQRAYDLVITDLKMESLTGLQLLSMIRRIASNAKVIIITGSNSISDEIQGLELDVDEYIQKPFSFELFLKRVERVLRREKQISEALFIRSVADDIVIDLNKREVRQNGQTIALTKKEYDMLVLLMTYKNRVIDRKEIINTIWNNPDYYVDGRTVDTHVKNLRAKLVLTSLSTIRGVGYEWIE